MVLEALRESSCRCQSAAIAALQSAALFEESACLRDAAHWARAERLVSSGAALGVSNAAYPARWRRVLGASSPAALWAAGPPPLGGPRFVAVVGSRTPTDDAAKAVTTCVREIGAMGFGIVSGGARGIDRLALEVAQKHQIPMLVLLPAISSTSAPSLSMNHSGAKCQSASFMERNVLIYAAAEYAIAFGPRFKEGGTWHGALEAHRRRLTKILVYSEDNLGARALISIGIGPYDPAEGLASALAHRGPQHHLPMAEPWG